MTDNNAGGAQYAVSALLAAHTDDVRALCSCGAAAIFSASRDGTVILWTRTGQNEWEARTTLSHGIGYVNSVAWIADSEAQEGALVGWLASGGQDSIIQLWRFDGLDHLPTSPTHTLFGHMANVCCLEGNPKAKELVSGSWDGTACRWSLETFERTQTLEHEGDRVAVWAVLPLPDGRLVTAAGDSLIRIWTGEEAKVVKGHEGPVRSLARVSFKGGKPKEDLIASASNDETIRVWTTDGDPLNTLTGQGSFIYSVCCIPVRSPDGSVGLASAGEEGVVKVWEEEEGECEQSIVVPATSVWVVKALPNGDLILGCSDNLIWVFSKDPSRAASSELKQEYDSQMLEAQERRAAAKRATAPAASASEESAEPREKMEHDGQLYDFVFTISTEDGPGNLSLPFNITDDPKEAAKEFLEANKLPVTDSTIDQIVEFIQLNLR